MPASREHDGLVDLRPKLIEARGVWPDYVWVRHSANSRTRCFDLIGTPFWATRVAPEGIDQEIE
jgi:hypothetical protein